MINAANFFFFSLINDALNVFNGINHVDTAFADGLMIAREQPAVAIGFTVSAALLVMPGLSFESDRYSLILINSTTIGS